MGMTKMQVTFTSQQTKAAHEIAETFVPAIMNLPRPQALVVMQTLMAVLFCNTDAFDTVTIAVDRWRLFSQLIEDDIRKMFGEVRYGDEP